MVTSLLMLKGDFSKLQIFGLICIANFAQEWNNAALEKNQQIRPGKVLYATQLN